MNIYPIGEEDVRSLQTFARQIDELMQRLCSLTDRDEPYFQPTDEWGHQDLPGYLPWMGPRYQFAGHHVPKSIFRGEGIALFLLMRLLRPAIAVECYTGTGYASAWMAAGSPETRIFTVDNYSEGGVWTEGHVRSRRLIHDLQLSNVTMIQGVLSELRDLLQGRQPDLFFSDGPQAGLELAPNAIVVRHDNLDGQAIGRSFGIRGGSNLSVMCPSVDEREELMQVFARYFPVERCDG